MSRRHVAFACEGANLAGTLDEASGSVGLLIVTGGNETRAGAFSGQAELAAAIAAEGYPVFRFDRRGTGDSEGANGGFRSSGPDIAAALAQFRKEMPRLSRVAAFGNCDGASALMLSAGEGFDALILANPWTIEDVEAAPPPAAIRARYAAKLRDPREIWRLVTGDVSLRKLIGGLTRAARPAARPTGLAGDIAASLTQFPGSAKILLASRDRTAQAFEEHWDPADPRIRRCAEAGHSFAESDARIWLREMLLEALEGLRQTG